MNEEGLVHQSKVTPLSEYIKDGWCCHQVCPYKKTRAAQEEGICKRCKTENYQKNGGRYERKSLGMD